MAFASVRARRRYQKEWRAAKYLERKTSQKCVDCGSELADGDGVKCARCDRADKDRKAIAREERPGLLIRERNRAKRYRRELLAAGKCIQCKGARGDNGTKMRCRSCQDDANKATATYRARVASRSTELALPRVRIMRAMRFLDWSTSAEILESAGVAFVERGSYQAALSRLRKGRLVEARNPERTRAVVRAGMQSTEYQLTEQGRKAVARLLRGLELA